MKFAKTDYYMLRNLLAEEGVELTLDELDEYLLDLLGNFELDDGMGIADGYGRGKELGNSWFRYTVDLIKKDIHGRNSQVF